MQAGFKLFTTTFLAVGVFGGALMVMVGHSRGSGMPTIEAAVELKNAQGQPIGKATLTETPNGILLRVNLDKAVAGAHAFHIHEVGRCEPPLFESAGGHFNPTTAVHGFRVIKGPHAGDLPNIHVPSSGRLSVEFLADSASLESGPSSLLDGDGAALLMHANSDDYHTDPAGAAGDRIACGVVVRKH